MSPLVRDNLIKAGLVSARLVAADLAGVDLSKATGAGYAQKVIAMNPLAYWRMEEQAGTAALDEMGKYRVAAYHGLYTGVNLGQPGAVGLAPFFDGTNDFVNIYSTALNSGFNGQVGTLAAFVKVANAGVWTDATGRRIAILRVDANNQLGLTRNATNNNIQAFYTANATAKAINVTTLNGTLDWFHIAMTWDLNAGTNGEFKLFLLGVQAGTTQTSLGAWSGNLASGRNNIGCDNTTGPTVVWSGWIDEVPIWTRVLAPPEIASLATR